MIDYDRDEDIETQSHEDTYGFYYDSDRRELVCADEDHDRIFSIGKRLAALMPHREDAVISLEVYACWEVPQPYREDFRLIPDRMVEFSATLTVDGESTELDGVELDDAFDAWLNLGAPQPYAVP